MSITKFFKLEYENKPIIHVFKDHSCHCIMSPVFEYIFFLMSFRQAEIHRTSDIDEETSQCPVNVVKTPDKMSYVFNVQPLKL